jgi:hypothetical protein
MIGINRSSAIRIIHLTMKNILYILTTFLLFTVSTYGQQVRLSLLFPPMKAGDLNWNDINTYVLPSLLITDVTVAMPWSTIETGQGVYDFNTFDLQLNHFIGLGKTINIVIQPISPSGNNKYTPSYIFSPEWATSLSTTPLDVVTCSSFLGDGTLDSGMPVPYEIPFKQGLKNFFTQVINHYKNNPNIGYIRPGLAIGGDFFPRCSTVMPGYADSVWTNYAAEMNAFEESLKPTMQLMQSVTQINAANDGNADIEAANAFKNGITIGVQGWEKSDNTAKTATSDWVALFNQYYSKIGPLELQTLAASDPTGASQTGSLVDLIPFAVNHHAQILELYTLDWLLALDPNYSTMNGATQGYASYASAYLKAITDVSTTNAVSTVNDNSNGYSMYPNPSLDNLYLSSQNDKIKSIQIFNSLGQKVYHIESGMKLTTINTSQLSTGFYTLNVKEEDGRNYSNLKFVKR